MTTKQITALLAGIVVIVAMAVPAMATSIGVNFVGGGATLTAADTAGVFAQDNWNNAAGYSGTGVSLNDNTGSVSGATLTYTSGSNAGLQSYPSPLSTGDEKMMNGVIMSFAPSSPHPVDVTISNIPYTTYDAYVYVGATWNSGWLFPTQMLGATVGSTTYYEVGNPYHQGTYAFSEITSTNPAAPTLWGNYIKVTGLTGPLSVTLFSAGGPAGNPGLYGVQLVSVPEPATMALLVLGGIGMVIRRRRAA